MFNIPAKYQNPAQLSRGQVKIQVISGALFDERQRPEALNPEYEAAAEEIIDNINDIHDLWRGLRARVNENQHMRIDIEGVNNIIDGQPYYRYSLQRNGRRRDGEPTTYASVYIHAGYQRLPPLQHEYFLNKVKSVFKQALYEGQNEGKYERKLIPLCWQI